MKLAGWVGLAAVAAAVTIAPSAARAQALAPVAPDPVTEPGAVHTGPFRVSLGIGVALRPDYTGSRSTVAMVLPQADVRWRDSVFISTTGGLPSLGANLLDTTGWRAGPVVRLRFPRYQNSNAALNGMGNIGWTPEVGGFLEYRSGSFRLGGEVRRGVGDHDGIVAELRADAVLRPVDGMVLSFGPRLNLGDESFTRRYFGVDANQAARTGYATHRPGAGVTSVGAAAFATYALTSNLSLTGLVEYSRLQNGAADSPLVQGRGDVNQVFTALSLTYSFGW